MPIYAVRKGRKTGLFNTWDETKEQVLGCAAEYKKFESKADALRYLNGENVQGTNTKKKKKQKFYALLGTNYKGIVTDWSEAQQLIKQHSIGPGKYKGFLTREDAERFLKGEKYARFDIPEGVRHLFIDGSFDNTNLVYASGLVDILNTEGKEEVVGTHKFAGNEEMWAKSANVAAELVAGTQAILYMVQEGIKEAVICYDYVGIENYVKKVPQTGGITTWYGEYVNRQIVKHGLKVTYRKVPTSHSHYKWNDMVDELAAEAIRDFNNNKVGK